MNEKVLLMTREDAEDFINGNDNPEYGTCWKHIEQNLESSYKNIQTEEIISQRISDGKYFIGYYEWERDEGWFPYRWDNDEPYMELEEVFPHYTIQRSFKTEQASQYNIIDVLKSTRKLVDLITHIETHEDEYAFRSHDDWGRFENSINNLRQILTELKETDD